MESESETANGGAEALSEFDSLVGETCERLLSLSLRGGYQAHAAFQVKVSSAIGGVAKKSRFPGSENVCECCL